MNTLKWVFITFFTITSFLAQAGVITMTGYYKGQNIFIQNPFNSSTKQFCIVSIYVNKEKKASSPMSTAVEVNLNGMETNTPLEIKIIYKKGCKPKIINPQAIKSNTLFSFTEVKITHDSYFWSTNGERKNGTIHLEHYKGDRWVTIVDTPAKGNKSDNLYEYPSEHHTGYNRYRVAYIEGEERIYSHEYYFNSTQLPCTFHPKKKVDDAIYFFSQTPVYYIIYDKEGKIALEGKGKNIDCKQLEGGQEYKIYYDNKFDTFKVKKRKSSSN